MYIVKISDHALDTMLLAAAETYYLGAGTKRAAEQYVEVNGYLWGSQRLDPDTNCTHVFVDRFGPSISSRKSAGAVRPNSKASGLMHAVIQRRAPHLAFLGDFHTHPYDSLQDVMDIKGWEFSNTDRQWWPARDAEDEIDIWRILGEQMPLWLVVAVAPLQRVFANVGARPLKDNVWRFDIGELRFWLNAEMGKRDKDGIVQFVDDVFLDMFPPFTNDAGDRLVPDQFPP